MHLQVSGIFAKSCLNLQNAESRCVQYSALIFTPLAMFSDLADKSGLTPATVNKALDYLLSLGILSELTSQKRNRLFLYKDYYNIMNKGTELPD